MKKSFALILSVILVLSGCGASNAGTYKSTDSMMTVNGISSGGSYSDVSYEDVVEIESIDSKSAQSNVKLVYSCSLEIETIDYANDISYIRDAIKKYNGIIEYELETDNQSDWYYTDANKTRGTLNTEITIRVKSNDYDSFLQFVGETGKIVRKEQRVDNITQSYYDTSATIESLKIQEQRLLDMYDNTSTIEEMITVEARLTEIQTQLRTYQTRMDNMNTDVEYATVHINIREVMEYSSDTEEDTFMNRLDKAFKESGEWFLSTCEAILFFIIHAVPQVALVSGLLACLLWAVRNISNLAKRKSKSKEKDTKDIPTEK